MGPVRATISDVLQQVGKQIVGHTHLQSCKFPDPHSKILLLAGMLSKMQQSEAHTVSAPVAKKMAKLDKTQVTVFADSVLCLGNSAMNESNEKIRWKAVQLNLASSSQVTSCTSVWGREQRGNSTSVKTVQQDSGTDWIV